MATPSPVEVPRRYRFERFLLDLGELSLTREGTPVRLRPQAVRVLGALVERAGRLVSRQELRAAIWDEGTFVDFNLGLNVAIKQVREAIGDDADRPRFIETVPRSGYRFIAPVEPVASVHGAAGNGQSVRGAGAPPSEWHAGGAEAFPPVPPAPESSGPSLPAAPLPKAIHGHGAEASRRSGRWQGRVLPFVAGALGATAVAAAVYLAWLVPRLTATPAGGGRPPASVVVLPFDVSALPPDRAHLSVGLADALITRLGNAGGVAVQPTSAIVPLRGIAVKDPVATGRQLGADLVVEGRVRPEGSGVSVTLQAVRVRDRSVAWAGEFHDGATTVAQAAGAMAAQLVHALGGGPAPRVESATTKNPEAYEAYLRGRHLWNRRDTLSMTAAMALYRRAIELDPGFALAYVGIANVHAFRATPEEAERNLTEALRIDPTLPAAQATLGFLRMFHYWDWQGAERAFRQALSGDPGDATAHHWYGLHLMLNRRFDLAIASLEQAKALEPVSAPILTDLGVAHHVAGDDARAVELCTQALQMEPGQPFAKTCLAEIYERQGKHRLAVEVQFGRSAEMLSILDAEGYAGIARWFLRQMAPRPERGAAYQHAQYAAVLGKDEEALAALHEAVAAHEFLVPFANVSKRWDRVRGSAAFQDAMRKVGLNAATGQ